MIYSHTISHDPEKQGRRYWDEESTPLFPFGYGLSYGEIVYGQLNLDRSSVTADESLTVSVEVTNQGPAAAEEVVQLYIHQRHGSASRPVRELKGFERISLDAGETRTVRFTLGPAELRYWNAASRDWVQDPSTFDVWVGGSSSAELGTTFDVTG
jgi:beta-glucosidase